jgi:PKD repeat protein
VVLGRFTASSPRQVTITLTVTDSLGFAWNVSKLLTVYPAPSQPAGPDTPPLAVFTIAPNPVAPGQAVTFDASRSSDSRGSVTDYKWDFGDGTPVLDTGATSRAVHRYACTGRVTTTLTATNDGGQTGQAREQMSVTPQPGSPPCPGSGPAASFTAAPNPTPPETAVAFDASASNDSSGSIVDYFWEFGDGTHGDSASPTITHSYFCIGTVTVTLTITDGSSLTDQTTRSETVAPESGFPPCSRTGARDAPRAAESLFSARLVRVRVLSRGVISRHGSTTTLRGVTVAGTLRGSLAGPRGLARFERARFVAALTFVADRVDHAIAIRGIALATFPGPRHDELCLGLGATRRGARVPLGAFRILGGTGAASNLSGGGALAFALGRGGGRLAGQLRVDRAVRRGRDAAALPAACRPLAGRG